MYEIKDYFEEIIGSSIYALLPGIVENTFFFLDEVIYHDENRDFSS
ncbi:hypothetical protein [Kosmotoga pacifica]|nr:hypothetical protein [Kosmotoga pacifica]